MGRKRKDAVARLGPDQGFLMAVAVQEHPARVVGKTEIEVARFGQLIDEFFKHVGVLGDGLGARIVG